MLPLKIVKWIQPRQRGQNTERAARHVIVICYCYRNPDFPGPEPEGLGANSNVVAACGSAVALRFIIDPELSQAHP